MEIYFSIIRNHDTKLCSVIGALSADEEQRLVNKIVSMQAQKINCDRISLNLDNSINKEIENLVDKYTLVPINSLFNGETFINIE